MGGFGDGKIVKLILYGIMNLQVFFNNNIDNTITQNQMGGFGGGKIINLILYGIIN